MKFDYIVLVLIIAILNVSLIIASPAVLEKRNVLEKRVCISLICHVLE
ncbi:16615_t:CDS:2 [Dentiscutata heterogama]|uniref:16615_t:CDS:1 n=1 Tax=Dentiscutata heterogama TaxID=1316150 RepID=A0ACA9K4V7_9GLOM|nr:16615_t:CDS:2 [Dentiscutata heterogama]